MIKKRKQKQRLILIFLIIITFFAIIYKTVNDKRSITKIESLVKDTGLFVNKIAAKPFIYINNKIKQTREKKNLYEKYKQLENKLKNYDNIEAKKDELEFEIKQLKKTLEINNTLSQEAYLNATVINRNVGAWYNTITIDKGSKNGVKSDMAVIVNEGLIGKITKTSNFSSTVKLLTSDDINNKISVKIKNKEGYVIGLLTGYNKSKNVFIIEGMDQTIDIIPGSNVTTTGLGGYFPSGIIVGNVKRVGTDHFDLSKVIEVESNVNFNQINFVTILKKEEVFE